MYLSSAVVKFLEYLATRDSSRHTIKNYDHYLRRFWDYSGEVNCQDITTPLIAGYSRHLTRQNFKKSTQNYHLIALRTFLLYLQQSNIPSLNPKLVQLINLSTRQVKTVPIDALRLVVEAPDTSKKEGLRDRAVLEVLFCSGLRVAGVAGLNRKEVDLINQTVEKYSLSDQGALWLEMYLKSRKDSFAPLFIRFQGRVEVADNGEKMRLSERSIERIVKKYAQALNLEVVTPESFRQRFGLDLAKHANLKTVAKKLGHKNLSTTKEYLKAAHANQS